MTRFRWIALAVGGLVLVGAGWLLFGRSSQPQQQAIYSVSQNYRVCLASTAAATPAWPALQAAHGAINAQQVTVPASAVGDQVPYLNGLLALKCRLIVVAGADLHDAATTVAKANPKQQFVTVGTPLNLPNVHDLPDASGLTRFVTDAAAHS